jgi:hypothetical protein
MVAIGICTRHTTRAIWFQDQHARFSDPYVGTYTDIAVLTATSITTEHCSNPWNGSRQSSRLGYGAGWCGLIETLDD